ncbi:MAG: septum formation inhibitor MinC, partial [Xanthobacteraceae bacterium]
MTSANGNKPQESMRLRARSFMAFVLTPALPVGHWLAQLDKWSSNSPDFFRGRPIILDLAGSILQASEITQLITHLAARGIRVMAIEGAEANQLDPLLPPLVQGGRTSAAGEAIAADGAVIAV